MVFFSAFFFGFGIQIRAESLAVWEYVEDYTELKSKDGKNEIEVTFEVKNPIDKTIYLFYEISNFYQNHRRFLKSRDYPQLSGVYREVDALKSSCDPIVKNSDLHYW